MAASLTSRFAASDEDAESGEEGSSSETSSGEYEAELQSMTGKGIKRLCSELLELKKASDEDFQRNVYSNYPVFVRIFKEVTGVENDLTELKQHVSSQRRLVQALRKNLSSEIPSNDSKDIMVEDLEYIDLSSPDNFGSHRKDILEMLDSCLVEHRLEEALALLEKETTTSQNLQVEEDRLLPMMRWYTYAIADRWSKLADLYALVAEHPRVAQPELQKALSGLSRMGENDRVNILLLKFYRSRLQKNVDLLNYSKPLQHGIFIRELSSVVFSGISQAARCFVTLYGETSPYTTELIQWAREEVVTFGHSFETYVKSISEMDGGLSLAVESVKIALSFCSLLESQRIALRSDLVKLMRPCMEKVLEDHVNHFKKDVSMFASTDNWDLVNFCITEVLGDKAIPTETGDKVDFCQLTISGRKFATLMKAIADDLSPLVTLRMETSILNGLSDIFNEYMCALKRAIPNTGVNVAEDAPQISSAQEHVQQLSLLVSSSTLAHICPSIAGSVIRGINSSNGELSSDHNELFMQDELESWMSSIQESADQLRGFFCLQFVYQVMSFGNFKSATCLESDIDGHCISTLSQDPLPSFAFQALFLQLRKLEEHSKSIFIEEDEIMEKLLKELMETVVVWLFNNQDFWDNIKDCSSQRPCSSIQQFYLDMHFLLEIARLGDYFSDNLMDAVLDLMGEVEAKLATTESDPYSTMPDEAWASHAAKMAINKLLEAEVAGSEPEVEPSKEERLVTLEACPSEGGSAISVEENMESLMEMKSVVSNTFGEEICDVITADDYNDGFITADDNNDGFGNPSIHHTDVEDGQNAIGTDTNDRLSEKEGIDELGSAGKAEIAVHLDEYDAMDVQSAKDKPQGHAETENLVLETELLKVSDKLDVTVSSSKGSEGTVISPEDGLIKFSSVDAVASDHSSESSAEGTELGCKKSSPVLQSGGMNGCVGEDAGSFLPISEIIQTDKSKAADETSNEAHSSEGEKPHTAKYTGLSSERIQLKAGRVGGVDPDEGSGSPWKDYLPRQRGARRRFKHWNATEGLGKNSNHMNEDDKHRVAGEISSEAQSSEEEKPAKYADLFPERIRIKDRRGGVDPVQDSDYVPRQRRGQQRFKNSNAAEGFGKNRNGSRAARPRWH